MKRKNKYYYNPDNLSFERIERDFRYWMRKSGLYLFIGIIFGIFFLVIFNVYFPSFRERKLQDEKDVLEVYLKSLDKQVAGMKLVLDDLMQRDDNLYRGILGGSPLPTATRKNQPYNKIYYDSIKQATNSQLLSDLVYKIDVLEKAMYTQIKSYEEIINLAKHRQRWLQHVPAIQPILNKDLNRIASGFGVRIHPIYHVQIMHTGMDFSAPLGTDVYATGDGQVSFIGWKQGYGNTIVINHDYGYETYYAHLYKFNVRKGQNVKRGDIIAFVGSTGLSAGYHLHYEVRINGHPVNPRNYFYLDLSPEEYDKMIQLTNNFGNTMD